MPKTKTRIWDPAEHLITEEDMAAYLEAALQEGDSGLIAAALGDIARAKGMSQIARDAGLGRESLYKALSAEGNPEFATIMKVVGALGLQLHASPVRVGEWPWVQYSTRLKVPSIKEVDVWLHMKVEPSTETPLTWPTQDQCYYGCAKVNALPWNKAALGYAHYRYLRAAENRTDGKRLEG